MKRTALITGITGQDGAYLASLLLSKGYFVVGAARRVSVDTCGRLIFLGINDHPNLQLVSMDLTDSGSIYRVLQHYRPEEIYNLGAQSNVGESFKVPEVTANVTGLGALRLLDAVVLLGLQGRTRIYQASSSELFGEVREIPQTEKTPFHPRSPYGVAKLYAYWAVVNYREAYDLFACNGILFNHESPLRGRDFVTRKIVRNLVAIYKGRPEPLLLGNLDAKRDWGHAKDYVRYQWTILQHHEPLDFVIASGQQHSVKDFCNCVAKELGMALVWEGEGVSSVAHWDRGDKLQTVIKVDPKFFRPSEVDTLLGDPAKARDVLGLTLDISFSELVSEMVQVEMQFGDKIKF